MNFKERTALWLEAWESSLKNLHLYPGSGIPWLCDLGWLSKRSYSHLYTVAIIPPSQHGAEK